MLCRFDQLNYNSVHPQSLASVLRALLVAVFYLISSCKEKKHYHLKIQFQLVFFLILFLFIFLHFLLFFFLYITQFQSLVFHLKPTASFILCFCFYSFLFLCANWSGVWSGLVNNGIEKRTWHQKVQHAHATACAPHAILLFMNYLPTSRTSLICCVCHPCVFQRERVWLPCIFPFVCVSWAYQRAVDCSACG